MGLFYFFIFGWGNWIGCNSFFVCRASDKCQKEKRKTINGDDLLWAMATLGFEDYIDPLKSYLTRYREVKLFLISGFYMACIYVCLAWRLNCA